MIHTKEVRFGNKLRTSRGEVITVQQVLGNSLVYDSKIEVNREMINVSGSSQTDYLTHLSEVVKEIDCADVEAIPLSQELLRKTGFRNFVREQWIFSVGKSHLEWTYDNNALQLRVPGISFPLIRYVHQLQNFLFAVAQYDLDVEL